MSNVLLNHPKAGRDYSQAWRKQGGAFLLCVLAMLGIAAQLFATKWGAGLNPDSTAYVGVARSLLNGHGLGELTASGEVVPLTHYPPLYPLLLSATGVTGIDPLVGARWLNALLFGANILLVGLLIKRYTQGSVWAALFGSILVLSCFVTLRIHLMAWSEPLFLFLGIMGLALLALHIERPRVWLLVAASTAIALALLTRYVGIAFTLTGAVGLLLFGRRTCRERIRDATILTTISALPMSLWIVRNLATAGSATHRGISFHPITLEHVKTGLINITHWVLPGVPGQVTTAIRGLVPLAVAVSLAVLAVLQFRQRRRPGDHAPENRYFEPFHLLLLTFIVIYTLGVAISISFFDYLTGFGHRMLSPVFVSGLIVVVSVAYRVLYPLGTKNAYRAVGLVLCVTLTVPYLYHGASWVNHMHNNGRGYASQAWQQSELISSIRALPPDVEIYTNGPDAVYILTGRLAFWIPSKTDTVTWGENKDYPSQLAEMGEALKSQEAVVAYFDRIGWRRYLPSAEELQQQLPLRLVLQRADGAMYEHAADD